MKPIAALMVAAGIAASAAAAAAPGSSPELSAAEIVDKNVAARGGLEAWHKIQTMVWVGRVESADGTVTGVPFLLEMKRPDKTRFEVKAQGARSVRAFDGTQGWKLRAGAGGEPQLQPYSAEEVKFERDAGGLDGPLIDFRAKGITVSLDGTDEVDGRKAYRLVVTAPSGASHHVWIDAESFLDVESDRAVRNPLGRTDTVAVHYRDYRKVDGVQVPSSIETSVGSGKTSEKMVIERVALNPPLEDRLFARPIVRHPGRGVTVDIPAPRPAGSFRPGTSAPPSRLGPSAAAGSP